MSEIKNFKLGVILTVTTGHVLLKKNDNFGEVHKLFWWVYDDNLIDDLGIGMLQKEMKEHLLKIHPQLKNVKFRKGINVEKFILKQEKKFGEFLPVCKINEESKEEVKHK